MNGHEAFKEQQALVRKVGPYVALAVGLFGIAGGYVALGLPVPAWTSDLEELERRINISILAVSEQVERVNSFQVDTRLLILQGDLASVQRELEQVNEQMEIKGGNSVVRRLRETLLDKERGLNQQIDSIKEQSSFRNRR